MIMYFLHIDLSKKSGATIVMVAFGAHFIKEILRTQLLSAAKPLLSQDKKKSSVLMRRVTSSCHLGKLL